MSVSLTTNLEDPEGIPYFLWDDPMTLSELLVRLKSTVPGERICLLARILREARDCDVWRFTSPQEVSMRWPDLSPRLGRRRGFWEYLLAQWRTLGLLHG